MGDNKKSRYVDMQDFILHLFTCIYYTSIVLIRKLIIKKQRMKCNVYSCIYIFKLVCATATGSAKMNLDSKNLKWRVWINKLIHLITNNVTQKSLSHSSYG